MNLLKDRIKTTQKNHLISMVGNAGSLASSLLIISSLFHPLGYVGLGIYSAAMIGNFVYKKVSAYNFENNVGMVNRDPTDPMFEKIKKFEQSEKSIKVRINDFFKWITCRLDYHEKDKKASVDSFYEHADMTGGITSGAFNSNAQPARKGASKVAHVVSLQLLNLSSQLKINYQRVAH
jgi:hypothetical protein